MIHWCHKQAIKFYIFFCVAFLSIDLFICAQCSALSQQITNWSKILSTIFTYMQIHLPPIDILPRVTGSGDKTSLFTSFNNFKLHSKTAFPNSVLQRSRQSARTTMSWTHFFFGAQFSRHLKTYKYKWNIYWIEQL